MKEMRAPSWMGLGKPTAEVGGLQSLGGRGLCTIGVFRLLHYVPFVWKGTEEG